MIFVILTRFTRKPTAADLAQTQTRFAEQEKGGIKTICAYSTFGRYDAIRIVEAPNEKVILRALMHAPEHIRTETMLAMPFEESAKLMT